MMFIAFIVFHVALHTRLSKIHDREFRNTINLLQTTTWSMALEIHMIVVSFMMYATYMYVVEERENCEEWWGWEKLENWKKIYK